MHRFYADERGVQGETAYLCEEDARHATRVLRMKAGEACELFADGRRFSGEISAIGEGEVAVRMTGEMPSTEARLRITLYQGLPKADKMEWIIQKTVELGVEGIYPVSMSRCIVKLDDSKKKSKTARWQAIAESAAKRSKRSAIPAVHDAISYKEALELAGEMDLFLVPYENKDGMAPTREALETIRPGMSVGILIGPEGGFSESEIEEAICAGGRAISLGRRILRTETAAITAVGMCMLHTEMHLTEEGV